MFEVTSVGYVNSVNVEINFISSGGFVFLCTTNAYLKVSRLSVEFLGYVLRLTSVEASYNHDCPRPFVHNRLLKIEVTAWQKSVFPRSPAGEHLQIFTKLLQKKSHSLKPIVRAVSFYGSKAVGDLLYVLSCTRASGGNVRRGTKLSVGLIA